MANWQVITGDCLDVMRGMDAGSVDTVISDPPYGLSFMGKDWDHGVPGEAFWAEALRVAKPGAMLLAFGGTRTYHRLVCAIEDAGWEIRDSIFWVYGSGFPKSHDISKAIDRAAGAEREVVGRKPVGWGGVQSNRNLNDDGWEKIGKEYPDGQPITAPATTDAHTWQGWGTALKPAHEPICVAMKPLDGTFAHNALEHGVAGLWIDGGRVGTREKEKYVDAKRVSAFGGDAQDYKNPRVYPKAQTPLPSGRWPANLIHDGSDEVLAGFPAGRSAGLYNKGEHNGQNSGAGSANIPLDGINAPQYNDTGSAARFFMACPPDDIELIFNRAKAIIAAWNQNIANTADSHLSLSSQHVASVLSDVAILAHLAGIRLSDLREHFTNATPNGLGMLCESIIVTILSLESAPLPDQSLAVPIPNGCLVRIAATQKQTGITSITIDLPISSGFAEPVTFNCTQKNTEAGGLDSASRFRYCAKASGSERNAGLDGDTNDHPTLKPIALMRYLARITRTPTGGVVLDPFNGSGSTGIGAVLEGRDYIGIEIDPGYADIARARIEHAAEQARQLVLV